MKCAVCPFSLPCYQGLLRIACFCMKCGYLYISVLNGYQRIRCEKRTLAEYQRLPWHKSDRWDTRRRCVYFTFAPEKHGVYPYTCTVCNGEVAPEVYDILVKDT